jgi:uncharacterized protein (TIGR03435 family)
MARIAAALESSYLRPALDRTGLDGAYDFNLKYDPRVLDDAPIDDSRTGSPEISLRSALETQLGLIIKDTKAPVDVLVIDEVNKPSQN